MKYLAGGVPEDQQLRKTLKREEAATLGQFAAANALRVGHVHGAITALWVLDLAAAEGWRGLKRARDGERPDLILKQHPYPQSLLRGRVMRMESGCPTSSRHGLTFPPNRRAGRSRPPSSSTAFWQK